MSFQHPAGHIWLRAENHIITYVNFIYLFSYEFWSLLTVSEKIIVFVATASQCKTTVPNVFF